ncbi:DUF1109 domain-containing protein [Sphingomonas sp. KR1UV-12]|uniref:DUF1109 domain-containing protein n=1 Tax=Sphingomonas aurea TaxID=3063994 RepID=A0ABT9EIU9_9SPHN|nr:DUF1109 domain-containing protein [Sphingomonas sp. KR1UV-12]MDP1026839.1 DUF1109 domain-containing protein [Sphingomonas sp. KR1UV-12]
MTTDDLVIRLARDAGPVRRGAVGRRLGLGIAAGAVVSAMLLILWLGPRDDLGTAVQRASYWIKWGYTLSLSAAALALTVQLARPDSDRLRGLWLTAIPVVLLAVVGLLELANTPRSDWMAMWLGRTWMACPWLVLLFAIPIFGGLLWSFRRLAPTRLRAAGAAAGFTAGAFAASVYCLHCPEVSAIFVLTWYSLGILLATLLGSVLGPRLLRW